MPVTAMGKGLPSGLINDVLVGKDGTFYAATTTGLAWSSDRGQSWSYVRGQDYAAKARGLYRGAPIGWKEEAGAVLSEDYVSCLSQDGAGQIWIGHWQAGSEMVQTQSDLSGLRVKAVSNHQNSGLVRAILPRSQGSFLLARYDEGLSYGSSVADQSALAHQSALAKPAPVNVAAVPTRPLPSASKAPALIDLNAMLASLGQVQPLDLTAPIVVPLADDWTTQGNWLGRYGRYWASLNAMASPSNYLWGGGWTPIDHAFGISPQQKDDALRYYVTTLQTDNPRSLEMPPTYFDSRLQKGLTTKALYRRQAELDDHGEDYPLTKEGPNIYFSVKVPRGLWTLSFYNVNKDGHAELNRLRDYRYSIRSHKPSIPIGDVTDFDSQPELAHSRQRDFRGGVYKRFLVRGPQELTVEVAKKNSLNTILAGVFLDAVEEEPAPYFSTVAQWQTKQSVEQSELAKLAGQASAIRAARFAPATNAREGADRLWLETERLRASNPKMWAATSRPLYAALARFYDPTLKQSAARQLPAVSARLGTCLYHLSRYDEWENWQRQRGLKPARDTEKSLRWDGQSADGEGFKVITAQLPHLSVGKTQ